MQHLWASVKGFCKGFACLPGRGMVSPDGMGGVEAEPSPLGTHTALRPSEARPDRRHSAMFISAPQLSRQASAERPRSRRVSFCIPDEIPAPSAEATEDHDLSRNTLNPDTSWLNFPGLSNRKLSEKEIVALLQSPSIKSALPHLFVDTSMEQIVVRHNRPDTHIVHSPTLRQYPHLPPSLVTSPGSIKRLKVHTNHHPLEEVRSPSRPMLSMERRTSSLGRRWSNTAATLFSKAQQD